MYMFVYICSVNVNVDEHMCIWACTSAYVYLFKNINKTLHLYFMYENRCVGIHMFMSLHVCIFVYMHKYVCVYEFMVPMCMIIYQCV